MPTDRSRSTLRGLLVPHSDWDEDGLWAAQSSYTQSGPRVGQAEPATDTDCVLRSSGTQSIGGSLDLYGQRAGFPEPGGGAIVWRTTGDTLYRGWDPPHLITSWEAVAWLDGGGSPTAAARPYVLSTAAGKAIVAYQATVGGFHVVRTQTRSAGGTWAAAVTAYSSGVATPEGLHPCMCLLPSGRVLLFHFVYDSTQTVYQLRMQYTDDDGATWVTGSRSALKHASAAGTVTNVYGIDVSGVIAGGALGCDIQAMRCAYRSGQILVMVSVVAHNSTPTNQALLLQYASRDLGGTFTLIETTSTTAGLRGFADVVATPSAFLVGWIASGEEPSVSILANAFDALSVQTIIVPGLTYDIGTTNAGGKYFDDGDFVLARDPDGTTYLLARAKSGDMYASGAMMSYDDGATWLYMSAGSELTKGAWWSSFDASTYVRYYHACALQGRLLVCHQWAADPGDEDNSIGALYLGGWSTVTMPGLELYPRGERRAGWDMTWLPLDEPGDVGWTAAGAGTDSLDSPGVLTVTTAGNARTYARTMPGGAGPSTDEGIIGRFALIMTSGGSLTATECGVRVEVADGAKQYRVDIRLTTTGFRTIDALGPTTLDSVTVDTTGGIEFLVALKGSDSTSNLRIWYRVRNTGPDREWVLATDEDNTLVKGAAGTMTVTWGSGISGNVTNVSKWIEVHLCYDSYTGLQIAQGQVNPDELFGRSLSPDPIWLDDGVHVSALDGPIYVADAWTIATDYQYAVRNIFAATNASPAVGWRSTGATEALIAVQASSLGDEKLGSDVLALYLDGCNWRLGELQGYDGGAWVTIAEIDMATGLSSLPFTRSGHSVYPSASASTAAQYIHLDEFVGGTFDLTGSDLRIIERHTEGLWTNSTTRRPVVYLSGVDGGDAASGTGAIWSPKALILAHVAGVTYQGFRIKIDAQSTSTGYFTIGIAHLGWVQVFGQEYTWDRSVRVRPNEDQQESRSGRRRVRRNGPARRAVEFGWRDGHDLTDISGSTPGGDYLLGTTTGGADPVALAYDTPYLISDIIQSIGQRDCVVYCPTIPKGTPNTINYTARDRAIYGRIVSEGAIEVVLGDESSSEVVTVPTVTIEEEV